MKGGGYVQFRHEWKHEINYCDYLILHSRLSAVMQKDPHAIDNKYEIRSIYFDNLNDKALQEKIDGVNIREKFRIRYYNNDTDYICLEKKSKINGLCSKESARLTKDEAQSIVEGNYIFLQDKKDNLCKELYAKMTYQGLRPRTIVDYTREPYIFAPGNVRVTIDYDIRTGNLNTDFLNRNTITVPAGNSPIILEVKWDEYLPDIIRDVVALNNRRVTAFSKYEQCRIYG